MALKHSLWGNLGGGEFIYGVCTPHSLHCTEFWSQNVESVNSQLNLLLKKMQDWKFCGIADKN